MKRALVVMAVLCGLVGPAGTASAQSLPDVPRNRTLISQGWDLYNQVPSPTNLSPYNGILLHERNNLNYTVNEALFYTNHNSNETIPWQATGWKYSVDLRDLTITLRDGVKWSDGEPFTADDVVFTFDMLRNSAPDMVFSSAIKEWVASAEAVDPHTVLIHLTKSGPRWAEDFLATGQTTRFIVVPKHIWQGQDPKTFGDFDLAKGWPVGTGPYKVVRSDSGSIVFDRLPHWWAADTGFVKAMPVPERIIYRPATAEAMPQLFSGNEIDMGRALPVGAFEAARARNPALVSWNTKGPVWGAPDGCTISMAFNVQTAPYGEVAVRQAIAAVVDRDQIADLSFEGSVPTALGPFSSLTGMQAYTSQLDAISKPAAGKPDPAKAEKLLTGAGFVHGADGKWQLPGGKPWPVTILTQQSDPIGPVLARQLQAAGFDAVFRPEQDSAYFNALVAGEFGTAIYDHCGSLYDPWQTLEHFHSKYAAAPGKKVPGVRTITRYSNPDYDHLIDQMEARQPFPERPGVHGAGAPSDRDPAARHAADCAHRGGPRRDVQHRLLDRMAERGRSVCRAIPTLGGFCPRHPASQAPAIAPC
jgi:peptide/nickel transport system substrate-binding protein